MMKDLSQAEPMNKNIFGVCFRKNQGWLTSLTPLVIGLLLFNLVGSVLAAPVINVGFTCNIVEVGPGDDDMYYTNEPYTVSFGSVTEGSVQQQPYSAGGCEYPAYLTDEGFGTRLESGASMSWNLSCPGQAQFCGGVTGGYVAFGADSCVPVNVSVNGSSDGSYSFPLSDLYNGGGASTSVTVTPQKILFQWGDPSSGTQKLTADGQSIASGTATNLSPNIVWTFDGANLGCQLLQNVGPVVVVQAGTNTGTVLVKGTDSDGTCCEQPLELVPCGSGGGCGCSAGGDGNGLSAANNCLDVRLRLGWALDNGTAGYLQIKAYNPSQAIATPTNLQYNFFRTDVEVYSNALGLYQIKTPQLFVNVVTNSGSEYTIQLYSLTNVLGDPVNDGGHYLVTNSPYRTITVENPGGSSNEVLITDSNDGATYDYTWQTNDWLLTSGGGLRNELKSTIYTNGLTISTTTVYSGSSTPVQTKVETWEGFSTNSLRLVQEVDGSGSAAQTNTYTYNTNGFLQEEVDWNGAWKYYVYDSYNRPTNIFSGFLNQGVTTNSALCRLTVNDYSTNQIPGTGDDGVASFLTPRCSIQYVEGQEVSRSYFTIQSVVGIRKEIQCVKPGAAWNDTNNLVTTDYLNLNGYRLNEPWETIHPDGTADIYQYNDASGVIHTNFTWSGHLDGTGTNIDDGTETITVIGPTGLTLSQTTVDVKSGITTSQEQYAYDWLNRLTTTTYLDGTYMQNSYDCCEITSQQGRDGTMTYYTYDALKRLLTTTVNGVTTSNVYDPAGRIIGTVRIGTDGSTITTSQATYNDAGQETSSTDGLGNTTTYTNYFDGSGQLVKQTTNPDGSTSVETDYRDGSIQSTTGTAVSPVRYSYDVESDNGVERACIQTIQLDTNDADTGDWTKTYTDGAGHVYKTLNADSSFSQSVYNNQGQLAAQVDPDGVTTLYQYDDQGRQAITATDMNTNGVIDFSGTDRITETISDVANDNGANVNRTRTYIWSTPNSSISNLVSAVETSVDGLQTWNIQYNNGIGVTNHSQTTYYPANGYTITTATAPDGSVNVTTNQYGRLISTTHEYYNGIVPIIVGQNTYGYDVQGRQNTITDARNGITTTYFNADDQAVATLTPSPDGVQTGQLTTNILDGRGRVIQTIYPDNTSVTNVYYPNGLLQETCGSRTYPVQYAYDAQGRMKTMTTWTNFASNAGAAVTTWNYDGERGFMTNKAYADGKGPGYTYTPAGRLATRTWARGIVTTYAYDTAGGLTNTSYSDGVTPSVTHSYDRLGRQSAAIWNGITDTLNYNQANQLLSESFSSGPLSGMAITNGYDADLRRTNLSVLASGSQLLASTYGYDPVSRLQTVNDGTNYAAYSYLANSALVGQILFTNNGILRMVTTKQYDYLNRLTYIGSASSPLATPFASYHYDYNSANQRTAMTNADNSYWDYQYDSLGQVISGKKYWSDGTPVAGQQFTYNFDDIGNRESTASGGDATGSNLRPANYTANSLNQITSRDVPGYVDILGTANPNATVTVNLQRAYRHGDYFRDELSVNNTGSAQWLDLTNLAVLNNGTNADIIATNTGNLYVAQTPEVLQYDADGNLTNDGRWSYVWDAENRLIGMTVNTNIGTQYQLTFAYDYQGRRIQKIAATNGILIYTNNFIYDGWNLVATLSPSSSLLGSYTWGNDLSGSMQDAGGVGGLLCSQTYSNSQSLTSSLYVYDGNGNVVALVSGTDGLLNAQYEYGPFGEVIRQTGPMAKLNPIRFSTKYDDDESDLLYYGFRYYKPSMGTWLTRDPLEEEGCKNLYAFVYGNPANQVDILGMWPKVGGGVVGSIQLSYNVCQGNVTLNGWVWVGVGFEFDDTWVGASAYYQGNPLKTWSVPPLFKCGKCANCCDKAEAAGLQWAAGAFKGGLFNSPIIEGGLLFTPGSKCDGSVEGIVLINLINYLPGGALLTRAASLVGGKAEAGVQVNVDVHLCVGKHGGIVIDSASIGGGGYIDIVDGDVPYSPTGPAN